MSKPKCHLEGAPCGGACFYTEGALRELALYGAACVNCLATLAKRDRAFQRKARAGFRVVRAARIARETAAFNPSGVLPIRGTLVDARAIAVEEGR